MHACIFAMHGEKYILSSLIQEMLKILSDGHLNELHLREKNYHRNFSEIIVLLRECDCLVRKNVSLRTSVPPSIGIISTAVVLC